MAKLCHKNLVLLVGGCWKDGPDKLCIVLEYCGKGSLADFLTAPTPNTNTFHSIYFKLVLGIAECFKYLHVEVTGDPVIHRDLKPANVLVSDDMAAKVADFGEARRFDAAEAKIRSRGSIVTDSSCASVDARPECQRGFIFTRIPLQHTSFCAGPHDDNGRPAGTKYSRAQHVSSSSFIENASD